MRKSSFAIFLSNKNIHINKHIILFPLIRSLLHPILRIGQVDFKNLINIHTHEIK